MKTSGKIFWACGIGAFIGTMIALEMNKYFWWVGVLAGGICGYMIYNFREVLHSIPLAWQTACNWELNPSGSKLFWKALGYEFVNFCIMSFWVSIFFTFVILFDEQSIGTNGLIFIFFLFWGCFVISPFLVFMQMPHYRKYSVNNFEDAIRNNKEFSDILNPFRVAGRAFAFIFGAFKQSPDLVTKVIKTTGIFLKNLFFLIHSDARLICGLDAAIGTVIGYYSGSAIIGFFGGAIFGVVNWEIVSKRILHVTENKM